MVLALSRFRKDFPHISQVREWKGIGHLLIGGRLMAQLSTEKGKFFQAHFTENSKMTSIFSQSSKKVAKLEFHELAHRWRPPTDGSGVVEPGRGPWRSMIRTFTASTGCFHAGPPSIPHRSSYMTSCFVIQHLSLYQWACHMCRGNFSAFCSQNRTKVA